jgi:type IV conjugative transfer system protein TraL
MNDDRYRIITALDRPIRIVIFTPAEFLMIILPAVIGVVIGGLVGLCIAISGLIVRKRIIRMQRKYSKQFIQGFMYWQLPASKSKNDVRLPLSYVREYVS